MENKKQLYLIVHEDCIDEGRQTNQSKRVKQELERVRREEDFLPIEELHILHPDMPEPSQDLEVMVCGAYYGKEVWCINRHMKTLKNSGYKAKIYLKGSLCYNHDR